MPPTDRDVDAEILDHCGWLEEDYGHNRRVQAVLAAARRSVELAGDGGRLEAELAAERAARQKAEDSMKAALQLNELVVAAQLRAEADAAAMRRELELVVADTCMVCGSTDNHATFKLCPAHAALSTDTGRALADFLARLRAAPCAGFPSEPGMTCLDVRPNSKHLWCFTCQSRSPDYGGRDA